MCVTLYLSPFNYYLYLYPYIYPYVYFYVYHLTLPLSLPLPLPLPYTLPLLSFSDESVHDDEMNGRMYYITDGVFTSFNCVPVYDIRPPFEVLGKSICSNQPEKFKHRKLHPSRIWGQTCDSADVLYKCMQLPEIEVGIIT